MDYQEQNVTGKKWRRCHQILIHNAMNETPHIVFSEEDVVELENDNLVKSLGVLFSSYDPIKTINIVDPTTFEPTEQTMTYAEVYHILMSAYLSVARERDAS